MTAAIYYHTDAFDTSRPQLLGRHSAGEGFMAGLARHADGDVLYCYARLGEAFSDFRDRVGRASPTERETRWIPFHRPALLAEPGCLFRPGPSIANFAWQRRFDDPRGYSLCGVTHTIATARIMDALTMLTVAPLQSWDAVICTSRVVKATVERVLETWQGYLEDRFGGPAETRIQLPIIPLGVDCEAFAPSPATNEARAAWRDRIGAGADDVVVLFMGRLSYIDKAHPLPMYLGLEQAARRSGKRIHLIQAGWFGHKEGLEQFQEGAKTFCPSINVVFVDGRKPDVRGTVWSAADIFTSLSDNVQETFGLTPLEAMAAGLPVVVSDWNGYRDTVRDGVDGFTVPTMMPPPGCGDDLALRFLTDFDTYAGYIGSVSQCTAVDPDACAEAYTRLALDAELRRRMGDAGRRRASETFDWRLIIRAYERLWSELAERRAVDDLVAPRRDGAPAFPAREDPFALFAAYPTHALHPADRLRARDGAGAAALSRVREFSMNTFSQTTQADAGACARMLQRLVEDGPATVADIVAAAPEAERPTIYRTLCWLAKTGLVRIEAASDPGQGT